jgi:hypothetical protein
VGREYEADKQRRQVMRKTTCYKHTVLGVVYVGSGYARVMERRESDDCLGREEVEEGMGDTGRRGGFGKNKSEEVRGRRGARTRQQRACVHEENLPGANRGPCGMGELGEEGGVSVCVHVCEFVRKRELTVCPAVFNQGRYGGRCTRGR